MRRAREREIARELKRSTRLGRKAALAAGIATGATVLFAPAAQATSSQVDTNGDTAPDGGCGTTGDANLCTLREAVNDANSDATADTITFASTVTGSIPLSLGQIPITEALSIQGPGADVLAVDANYSSRIFYVSTAATAPVSISGLELREGDSRYETNDNDGGAILAEGGSGPLTVANSVVTGSNAQRTYYVPYDLDTQTGGYTRYYGANGGGIAAPSIAGLTITNTEVSDNFARGGNGEGDGGGVFAPSTDVTVTTGSAVNDNDAGDAGGGVYGDGGDVTVNSSSISYNDAAGTDGDGGGGIYLYGADLTVTDSEVSDNNANNGLGGGVYATAEGFSFDVTITGSRVHDNGADGSGGGLFVEYGDLTVTGSAVSDNVLTDPGAGAGIFSDEGTLSVDSSRISRNGGGKYQGGGIFVEDTEGEVPNGVTITASQIVGNLGGGVNLDEPDDPVTIQQTTISENFATLGVGGAPSGGGINLNETDGDASVSIVGSTIASNVAKYDGGGIYLGSPNDPVTIQRTTVTDNAAIRDGGGIYLDDTDDDGTVTIDASTISRNEADDGGGIVIDADNPVAMQNSTVSGNIASDRGGGIFVQDLYTTGSGPLRVSGTAQLDIENSTISENSAEDGVDADNNGAGGGIYLDNTYAGDVNISSSIVANSIAGNDLAENTNPTGGTAGDVTIGFSLIENPGTTTFTQAPGGSNIIGVDPVLGPLANNGGPTETHLPALTSPVIDAGVSNGLATDQRGGPRTVDNGDVPNKPGSDATDMGSVEQTATGGGGVGPATSESCQGSSVVAKTGTAGNDTLTGTDDSDVIRGAAGNDSVFGLDADDCLFGEDGTDEVDGEEGDDLVDGGEGKDKVVGGLGSDDASGGGGNDRLKGSGGDDSVSGDGGDDVVSGAGGKDELKGGGGSDQVRGAEGSDKLGGGGGADKLKGAGGDDRLTGGGGKDRLNCGAGDDVAFADASDVVSNTCETVKAG